MYYERTLLGPTKLLAAITNYCFENYSFRLSKCYGSFLAALKLSFAMEGVKNVVSKSCLKLYFLKKTNVDFQGRKDLARKDDHDY